MKLNIRSIRFKAVFMIAALMLAVMLFQIFYLAPRHMDDHIQAAGESQVKTARQIASHIDLSFQQAIRELESIARLPEIVSMERERQDAVLSRMNSTTQFFDYYFVLDTKGIWVSYPSNPSRVGNKINHMDWVEKTFREGRTVSLDVIPSRQNILVSGFSTPIRSGEGEVLGLLRGVFVVSRPGCFLCQLTEDSFALNGQVFIVSNNGWLLEHPLIKGKPQDFGKYDYKKYPPVSKVIQGEAGIVEYEYEGRTWVAAYQPLKSTGWGVIAQQPKADILSRSRREQNQLSLAILFTFIIGAIVFSAMTTYALRPLGGLIRSIRMRKLDEGVTFRQDEIGQLANEFHDLFLDLSRSEDELRKHSDQLEGLVEDRTRDLTEANSRLIREQEFVKTIIETTPT